MSRRPSYVARGEDDDQTQHSWVGLGRQRPSVGQDLGMNYGLSYDQDDPQAMNYREDAALKEQDSSSRSYNGRKRDVRDFKIQRRKRVWERLLTVLLGVTLFFVLVRGKSGGTLLERAKLKVVYTKP
ncbi:hypothetical protein P7C70_g7746, partial [Phenoliferia sp. Uapishka_3]